ncbi:MAG: 30S ribosomal protein S20 [bacterium]
MKSQGSAQKRDRQNQRRRLRHKATKSRVRTTLKKTSAEPTAENLNAAYSLIDKAVKKHTIHKKAAARMKSKLARQVATEEEPSKTEAE